MNKTTFSVIIPTYNRAEGLRRALNSLIAQTYKEFEVIVCDDGSIDHTQEVVGFFKSYLKIKYLWDENWGGPSKPRNNGIRAASGEWICFLDSDDWWYPNKLKTILPYLQDADIIYHDMDLYNVTLKKLHRISTRSLRKLIFQDLMINGNALINSSVVMRKSIFSIIGYINEEKQIISSEDFDLWIRISKLTEKFVYIKKSLGGYLEGGNNISKAHIKHIESYKAVLHNHLNELSVAEQKEAISMFNYVSGRCYAIADKLETANKLFKMALSSRRYRIKLKSIISLVYFNLYNISNHR